MQAGVVFLWGFAATLVLSIILAVSRPLGITRMDLPFLLGTMFTSNRNKAPWYGFLTHLIIGWLFAFIYAAAFETTGNSSWWFGMVIGLVHAFFVLSAGLQIVGSFHPRMAQPNQGPTPTRQLEPPGFFAMHYGRGTPLVTILAHLVYGAILAGFYN
jgi:hypothetical protein